MQTNELRRPIATQIINFVLNIFFLISFHSSGAFEGLYAEWRNLTAEAYIRGEKWRRIIITTLWNIAVLMLAVVTPNITIAIEMLGK